MATVPNTTTFSLQDVVNVVGGSSLSAAFTNAVDACFDPTYKGSKNNLLNFRNYDTTRGATLTIDNTFTYFQNIGNTPCAGSSNVINITASSGNVWSASSNQAWCTLSPTGGTGSGSTTISCAKNTGADRSATVSITSSAPTRTCTVWQVSNCMV
jgi:hypothetical protein